MNVIGTALPGVYVIEPRVFREERGWLMESWNGPRYAGHATAGIPLEFSQDNVSHSNAGVLRGLHYQMPIGQGKLVSVLEGEIYDVAVDIRPDSPTFRRWLGVALSSDNHRQLWVPVGFAHGFLARTASLVLYKMTTPYDPQGQRAIRWSDGDLAIDWPRRDPLLSDKDASAPRLGEILVDDLPRARATR
jgi:dTDP-4-dehydrorhamnose 3,5-epimerase